MKKITNIAHRGHLKNLIKKGLIEVKCNYHLTDDYAHDNATGFGKTDWVDAYLIYGDNYRVDGKIGFDDLDFKAPTGYLMKRGDNLWSFGIHSNLNYDIRIKGGDND